MSNIPPINNPGRLSVPPASRSSAGNNSAQGSTVAPAFQVTPEDIEFARQYRDVTFTDGLGELPADTPIIIDNPKKE